MSRICKGCGREERDERRTWWWESKELCSKSCLRQWMRKGMRDARKGDK